MDQSVSNSEPRSTRRPGLPSESVTRSFQNYFEIIQSNAHLIARSKGWWDEGRELGTVIALMHSELSEALEYGRKGDGRSDHIPDYSGIEEELADVIIRIMDFAEKNDLRIAEAIIAKMAFNANREHKHGGKKF